MQAIIERCCGLDMHQETVVACLLVGAPGAQPTKEVRTFPTVTRDLEALGDWLRAAAVTHVGMESTGDYWRPVYAVLEGHFELIVGNARHILKILVSAYHTLAKSLPYRELGEAYLDQIGQTRTVANLKRRLERLGYRVTLEPTVQAT